MGLMIFENTRYLSLLIKRVYMALLCAFLIIACLAVFFAKKWHDISKPDNVYISSSENTLTAIRTDLWVFRNHTDYL